MTITGQGLDLDAIVIAAGPHGRRVDGTSLLEAVAWWAGEPHTDAPACVSPVLAAFGRAWAGALDDDDRQRLKPLIPALAATGGDGGDVARTFALVDWLLRAGAPAFARSAGLHTDAAALAQAARLGGWQQAVAVLPPLEHAAGTARTALEAAWARGAGSREASQAAEWAVRAAGLDAAAAGAAVADADAGPSPPSLVSALAGALDAATGGAEQAAAALVRVRVVVLAAVRRDALDAARAAALAAALTCPPGAAWAALRPSVRALQADAFDLLERLCTAEEGTS
jgi:hypothetical protein